MAELLLPNTLDIKSKNENSLKTWPLHDRELRFSIFAPEEQHMFFARTFKDKN